MSALHAADSKQDLNAAGLAAAVAAAATSQFCCSDGNVMAAAITAMVPELLATDQTTFPHTPCHFAYALLAAEDQHASIPSQIQGPQPWLLPGPSMAASDSPDAAVLELPLGAQSSLKISLDPTVNASVQALRQAVSRWNGRQAVHSMLALVMLHGSLTASPLQLMQACTADAAEEGMQRLVNITPTRDAADVQTTELVASQQPFELQVIAAYLLDVVTALPEPFRSCKPLLRTLLPPCLVAATPSCRSHTISPVMAAANVVRQLPSQLQLVACHAMWVVGSVMGVEPWVQLGDWTRWNPQAEVPDAAAGLSKADASLSDMCAASQTTGDEPELAPDHKQAGITDNLVQPAPPTAAMNSNAFMQFPQTGAAKQEPGSMQVSRQEHPRARGLVASAARPGAVSQSVARAVIEDIRTREFGIGVCLRMCMRMRLSCEAIYLPR